MSVSDADIRALADRIATEFRPERIVLFGSRAHGTGRGDSDVDLLIIMDFEGHPIRKAVEILTAVHPAFAIDLIVRHPKEVEWRYRAGDSFLHQALDRGRVLYEKAA